MRKNHHLWAGIAVFLLSVTPLVGCSSDPSQGASLLTDGAQPEETGQDLSGPSDEGAGERHGGWDAAGPIVGDRRVPFTPANDVQFIDFFVGHHKSAVEMAHHEVAMGSSAAVRAIAQRVVDQQTAEIEEMRATRQALTGNPESPPPPPDPHMEADMAMMMGMSGEALDQKFLAEMIAHHAAGLAPAERSLRHLRVDAVRELAKRIYDNQAAEVGEMNALRTMLPEEPEAGADLSLKGDRRVPLTPGDDVVFIDFFVDHHARAIEMATMVIERGARPEVRELAEEIIVMQTHEMVQMREARAELTSSDEAQRRSFDPHMQVDMWKMMWMKGEELDRMFLEEMIAHHGAGVAPALRARPHLERPDMVALAESIYSTQAREIGEMHALLDAEP